MNSIWHSLVWKEWHEHKWKLVSIVAVFWGTSAIPLIWFDRDMFAGAAALLFICSVPMAIFVGLGVASNERSRGTLAFTQALPIPLWRLALVKMLLGCVALFVPILLTVGLFYVSRWAFTLAGVDISRAVEQANTGLITGNWYADCLLFGVTIATSIFIWSAATGVNRKDEVSAGAVALAVMVGWYVVLFALGQLLFPWEVEQGTTDDAAFRLLAGFGLSTAPAGFVPAYAMVQNEFVPVWVVIVTAIATHLALANWYIGRFGRIEDIGVRSPRTATSVADRAGWLGAPRRSAITAIAWKQFRESGPLALLGVAGSVAITAIVILVDISGRHQSRVAELLADVYPKMAVMFGAFVGLVAGIGVCSNDMGPQISTFWRSRPIQFDLWFWSKFTTGLAVVLASIYVPIGILGALGFPVLATWSFPDAIAIPAGHIALFAAAVAMTVLVRHAVYAAILSIAVVYLGVLVGLVGWLVAGLFGWMPLNARWWEPTQLQVIFGMILSFAISTIVAWLAMRYDWGWKSRY
jgi:ABC-type transport system involved in multi-copper enzyme maturation permease subunit